jgi:hypothetical protein
VAACAVYLYTLARPQKLVLQPTQPPVAKVETSLQIISAYYGTGSSNDVDVSGFIRACIGNALSLWVGNNLLDGRPDPASGLPKRLEVEYSFGNKEIKKVARDEYHHLVLPEDETAQAELEKLRKLVVPATKPKRQLSESEFKMQQTADSEFRQLTWAQRVALRQIYVQPGQYVGQANTLLTNLGFADPKSMLDALQRTSLIHVDGRHNLSPSPFPAVSDHVEEMLKLPL